jgi:hypothetical protein
MLVRVAISVAMVVALAARVEAQPLIRPRVVQLVPVEVDGTITAVRPPMISVTNAAGERCLLQISQETVVRVLGTAEPDMLRVKQYVRVVATVDKRQSKVKDKVDKITLSMPAQDPNRMPGVFYPGQEGGGDLTPPAKGPLQPKAAPPADPPAAKPPKPAAKGKDHEDKDGGAAANEELLDVRGYISKIKGNQLTIDVPNAQFKSPLRLELDPQATIDLDLLDYTMAKAGDRISARGVQLGPQLISASEVGIMLSTSLTTKKRPPTKPLAKQPSARPKPDEPPPFEVANADGKAKPEPPAKELPAAKDRPPAKEPPAKEPPVVEPPVVEPPAKEPSVVEPPAKEPPAKEPPAAEGDAGERILPALCLKPEELKGKAALTITLGGGDPVLFIPAKEESGASIRKRFGDPKEAQTVQGSLPIGEEGARKEVNWQMWTYGSLKILVDETGKIRYFHLGSK